MFKLTIIIITIIMFLLIIYYKTEHFNTYSNNLNRFYNSKFNLKDFIDIIAIQDSQTIKTNI
jgi:hypothetical protein